MPQEKNRVSCPPKELQKEDEMQCDAMRWKQENEDVKRYKLVNWLLGRDAAVCPLLGSVSGDRRLRCAGLGCNPLEVGTYRVCEGGFR